MIYLFTGANGSRKTASAIHFLLTQKQFRNRPIYFNHVNKPDGLRKKGWIEIDDDQVRNWRGLPKGSVIFVDETWRIFPARPDVKRNPCPQYVADLKEHRLPGYDFIFCTQMPGTLDKELRGLVSDHRHLIAVRGLKYSKQYQYDACKSIDEKTDPSRIEGVIKSRVKVPSRVFKLYESTKLDTHGIRINPKIAFAIIIASISAIYIGVRLPSLLAKLPGSDSDEVVNRLPQAVPQTGTTPVFMSESEIEDLEVFHSMQPRIPGAPWTAPQYDKLNEPTEVPKPLAAITFSEGKYAGSCIVYSQQGTLMDVDKEICFHIVKYGWFDNTKSSQLEDLGGQGERPSAQLAAPAQFINPFEEVSM